ncbi:hypothetical protein [Massilia pseudoviolaceinigra]|uniref:hypothetical protein n=1 Tax=Massilia pseudoviolaceinigra TaxID=3057165 RepID=UPI0027968877|nr:hypothetical protein [Massilia sp. CCM 9206]MDQ1921645.1 hypothetical protein [Massilia sp. CCM 9206]
MTQTTRPSKELVRAYLSAPERKESPPQTLEEIKRVLGWHMIPENGALPEVPD